MTTSTRGAAVLPTYARQDVTFVRGDGSWLIDSSGKLILCQR